MVCSISLWCWLLHLLWAWSFGSKRPISLKDKSLRGDMLKDGFYVSVNMNGNYFLKKEHQHFFQVQLEMRVTGVSYCDLMIRTPSEFVVLRI